MVCVYYSEVLRSCSNSIVVDSINTESDVLACLSAVEGEILYCNIIVTAINHKPDECTSSDSFFASEIERRYTQKK